MIALILLLPILLLLSGEGVETVEPNAFVAIPVRNKKAVIAAQKIQQEVLRSAPWLAQWAQPVHSPLHITLAVLRIEPWQERKAAEAIKHIAKYSWRFDMHVKRVKVSRSKRVS